MKYVPIIPCYNPPKTVLKMIKEMQSLGFKDIIVVDDGSYDKLIFDEIKALGCVLISHEVNMGKGKALKDGFNYYIDNYEDKYLGVVAIDCDGQHLVKDMISVTTKMIDSNQFTLGTRFFDSNQVPFRNKMGNKITSRVFKWLFGLYIKDTQTGLRAIPNRLISLVMNSDGLRFEYEINMLIDLVKSKEVINQVRIETIYLEEKKRISYFKPIKDSFRIYSVMIHRRKK